jgi:hypothetical protein
MSDNKYIWVPEIDDLLNRIRLNSIELASKHTKNFFEYENYSKCFDMPIIILSSSASFISGGSLISFIGSQVATFTGGGLTFSITMLTAMKLYLGLERLQKQEIELSKAFQTLALDVYKMLQLNAEHRHCDGLEYLNRTHNEYVKLIQSSMLLKKRLRRDFLMGLELSNDSNNYFSDTSSSPGYIMSNEIKSLDRKKSIMGTFKRYGSSNSLKSMNNSPPLHPQQRRRSKSLDESMVKMTQTPKSKYDTYKDFDVDTVKDKYDFVDDFAEKESISTSCTSSCPTEDIQNEDPSVELVNIENSVLNEKNDIVRSIKKKPGFNFAEETSFSDDDNPFID